MLWLDDSIRPHIPAGSEFEFVFGLEGEVFRAQKNRRMIRARIGDCTCFVKSHAPAAWKEIVKNASRGRWPVLTAEPEYLAIRRCMELDIPTVKALGVGVRGRFPAELESFIITEELAGFVHLDELPAQLASLGARQRARVHRGLIAEVARLAQLLHSNGLNHRDFYLNHFMLPPPPHGDWSAWNGGPLNVHVIDLHRMQIRETTPRKWAIKDISGLLFSAFDAGLTTRDWLRFLGAYWQRPWRDGWGATRLWRWQVMRRAVSLYQSERGRPPPLPASLASSA